MHIKHAQQHLTTAVIGMRHPRQSLGFCHRIASVALQMLLRFIHTQAGMHAYRLKGIDDNRQTGACVCMQELEPKAALQQIALPMNADKRAAGIATLSQLVWTADKSKLGMPRADFMRSVREQLTAAEQVRPLARLYSDYGHNHCTRAVCYKMVSIRYLQA